MDIRSLEKSSKIGYIFDIYYEGKHFDSFDEMKNKTTVKGEFRKIMESLGFTWAKGIQQGGRTDAKVSGSNCLYVSSNFNTNTKEIIEQFNIQAMGKMKITRVRKTFPNLAFPDYIKARKYVYTYPKKLITSPLDEIIKKCEELSGTYDVSEFTDSKGEKLKEHIRTVNISFEKGSLIFLGDSFMPKQVRIMSSYILTGEKSPLPGKYLKLDSVILKEELVKNIFYINSELEIENVQWIESNLDKSLHIFYVLKENKGKVIGKNASNIKKLKKEFGYIIVREI